MKNLFTFFCCFFFASASYAQGEANNWVFGQNAGVSWNSGVPVAFSGSAMAQQEGVCCISNAAGTLLFYSDGIKVWNRNHQQMPNGFGLMGHGSSTQSGVAVSWPGDTSKYFLFTQAVQAATNGFRYSVVDMSLQGGLGDVVASSKNTLLYTPSCEKISVTRHANGVDFWVSTHQWGTNAFYTYLVTLAGVNATPVISNIGAIHTGTSGNSIGYMKFSPDGQKIGVCMQDAGFVEVFMFNQTTGQVGTLLFHEGAYGTGNGYPYGLEFSPNSNLVYVLGVTNIASLYQYDLQAANIVGSRFWVVNLNSNGGALQLAVDHKIYAVRYQANYLSAINSPDVVGAGCGYQGTAVFLTSGSSCQLGLPTFVQSYFTYQNTFTLQNTCLGDATAFSITNAGADSTRWNFGDIASGAANLSSLPNPSHVFSTADTFTVLLRAWKNGVVDSSVKQVIIQPLPIVSLGNDTALCNGQSVLLNATTANGIYLWQNNSNNASQTITQSGLYWVEITVANCAAADTVQVTFYPSTSTVNVAAANAFFCAGDSTEVCATSGFSNYLWSNGKTDSCFQAHQAGNYYVTVTDNNGCTASSNALAVNVYPLPSISISVNGDTLTSYNGVTYQWYQNGNIINGAIDNMYEAKQGGSYTVAITDSNGCSAVSNPVIISGINNPSPAFSVNVYPNPLDNGFWNVDCATDMLGSLIEIFDADGRLVFESKIIDTNSQIELNAQRGIFLLRISSATNAVVRKLIRL